MHRNANKTTASRGGFTLFEILLAVFIGVMIIMMAVPSISGLVEERRANKLFNEFNDLTREASRRAVTERRAYVIEWDNSGVMLHPMEWRQGEDQQGTDRVDFGEKMAPELYLPAALVKDPPKVWTFWPTGTCEPATVTCHIADAQWTATYDPLTEQAVYSRP